MILQKYRRPVSSSLSSSLLVFILSTSFLLYFVPANDNTTETNTTNVSIENDDDWLMECRLCGNDNPTFVPQQNYSVFRSSDNDVISCQTAYELGTLMLPPENCTFWQNRGMTVCGCASEAPPINTCTLCEDGSDLPYPLKEGGTSGGRVCAQLQSDAIWDDPNNCITWQQTIGIYCGCNNPKVTSPQEHNVCRICGGSSGSKVNQLLVDNNNPNTIVEFDPLIEVFLLADDGSEITTSCGELEFDANLPGNADDAADTCDRYQLLYREECCVSIKIQNEDDNNKTMDDLDSGGTTTTNLMTIVKNTAVINLFLLLMVTN